MSSRSGSSERSTKVVAGTVAASVALVVVMWLALRPAQTEPGPAPAPVESPRIGVAPAEVDSARRDEGPDDSDARLVALPMPREQLPEDRARALDEPPQQIPPDPDLVAAAAARDAALPVATEALQAALDERQSAIAKACWKGGGDDSQVFVQASFDASGKLTGHQVADNGRAPAGLRECVGKQPFALKIAPPGAEVTVRATMSFP